MTESVHHDPIQQAAADWFARLQGDAALEDWTAFQAWLEADTRRIGGAARASGH